MPLYQYRARDKDGALRTGEIDAARKEAVADRLSGLGYIPVMIEEQGATYGKTKSGQLRLPLFAVTPVVPPSK